MSQGGLVLLWAGFRRLRLELPECMQNNLDP